MNITNILKIPCFLILFSVLLQSCGPPGEARKIPVNPDERVKKILKKEKVLD
jgi:hypothetical protein